MDYNKVIGDRSAELAKEILFELFTAKDEIVVNNMTMADLPEEEKEEKEKAASVVFGRIYSILAESDLPLDYADYPLTQLEAMVNFFKTRMSQVIRQAKEESFDLTIGHKNENGDLEGSTAPIKQVLMRLQELRTAAGK